MLDIQIFRVDKEIKKDGKVVGSVPKVSLGTYTPIPVQTQTHISKAMKEFGQENAHSVEKNLVAIGIVDTFANYTKILEGKIHPYVRQVVSRQLSMRSRTTLN